MNDAVKSQIIDTKKKEGKYYTGFFQDGTGNPDFKGLGPFLKCMLYLFLFSILLTDNNKYIIFFLFLFFIGRILVAIRYYYVEPIEIGGNDTYFIHMNIVQNFVEGFTAIFVMLYILFHRIFNTK